MYIIDLFTNIIKKKNFGVLIWLIINTVIVTFCFTVLIDILTGSVLDDWLEYLLGFVAYIGTMIIALSPLGETILRWQTGCKKITDKDTLERLERIFNEVRENSAELDSSLNRKISFFMSDDEEPNAFATGRKTVCVTKGLLEFTDDEIKGVLAHEFGHLSHKDTDVILVIAVGNMFVSLVVSAISLIVRIFNWIIGFFISLASDGDGFFIGVLTSITNFIINIVFGAVLWLWTKLGVMICMSSSRQNEFHADKFAYEAGYGAELRNSLVKLNGGSKEKKNSKTLWASLSASHPDTGDRIEKLESYMSAENNVRRIIRPAQDKNENKTENSLRGFNLDMNEEDYFKTVYIPHKSDSIEEETVVINPFKTVQPHFNDSAKPEPAFRPENDHKESKSMFFHKFNMFLLIPIVILSSVISLVTSGSDIADYGFDAASLFLVILNFAQILVSISSLIDFRNRNISGYYSVIASRIMTFVSFLMMFPEYYNSFLYEGFSIDFATVSCVFTFIVGVLINAAIIVYYTKRKDILFDNSTNN